MGAINKHKVDKVIALLKEKEKDLITELRKEPENQEEVLELKVQVVLAIKCLKFCADNGLVGVNTEIIKIPEEGSEGYYTEYNLVDEAYSHTLDEHILKSNDQGEIMLNCLDLIIRIKSW